MTGFDDLPNWRAHQRSFCERIAKNETPFKIILKTKDEPARLNAWIEHHTKIVGLENLIIFDNMSTDHAVFDIYARLDDAVPIIRYTGFHNNIHQPRLFPDFYGALRVSCKHYTFLDTDEFLVLYGGNDYFYSDHHIPAFLSNHRDVAVFPGTWLQNLNGFNNRFVLQNSGWQLRDGLKWGKPIISSCVDVTVIILHNSQIKWAISDRYLVTNLFVLHRSRVSSAERIHINLHKLRARNQIKPTDALQDVLTMDIETISTGREYVQEIRQLAAAGNVLPSTENSFEIEQNGEVHWNTIQQQAELNNFIINPTDYSESFFSAP